MHISFFLMTILLAAFIAITIKNNNIKGIMFKDIAPSALIIIWIIVNIMLFPVNKSTEDSIFLNILVNFFIALNVVKGAGDVFTIKAIETQDAFGKIYFFFLYLFCFISPFLTISVLINLWVDLFDEIAFYTGINKTHTVIFSSFDERSIQMAIDMDNERKKAKKKRYKIIFCDSKSKYEEHKEKRSIRLIKVLFFPKKTVVEIKEKSKWPTKQIDIFLLSQDNKENLKNAKEIIENHEIKSKIKTRIFLKTDENIEVFEEALTQIYNEKYKNIEGKIDLNKRKIEKLEIYYVNPIRYACYKQLEEQKLFEAASTDRVISALVLGSGECALEMAKAIAWLGQLPNYNLILTINDSTKKNIKILKEKTSLEKEEYISFLDNDKSHSYELEKFNYVVIDMDDDDESISTAFCIAKYYLRKLGYSKKNLKINVRIKDRDKSQMLSENYKNNFPFDISFFGDVKNIYCCDNFMCNDHDQKSLANSSLKIHEKYDKKETFISNSYNQRSSMSAALYARYIYHLEKANTNNNDYMKKMKEKYGEYEHKRWKVFMLSEGYEIASIEYLINNYKNNENNHNFKKAKYHPILIEWEDLNKLKQVFIEKLQKEKNFKKDTINSITTAIDEYHNALNN